MKARIMMGIVATLIGLASCSKNDDTEALQNNYSFRFNEGTHDWTGDFADYPVTDSVFYELEFTHSKLPAPLDTNTKSLKIAGNNHSDDLFMFIKRKFSGLSPNRSYNANFELEFASNAPTNAIGVGGSPGESVTVKVGASNVEPKKINKDGFYEVNIDKGNQSQSGNDMKLIGNVGVSDTTTVFTIIKRNNNTVRVTATANNQGELWLIIGTESGFEAKTTLYFKRIEISLW